ncbi:MAG: hypothetical protein WCA16_07815 [Candidatus Sulfotelmatobacter sp.]
MPPKPSPRPPRWYLIPVRVLLITFIGTLASFAVSLLLGIVGTVAMAWMRGVRPNMTVAYRVFALPAALVAGGVIFVLALAMEVRHYRQMKTLAAIERVS